MNYDVLSLGPARMDVFVHLPDEQVQEFCNIDRKNCVIQLGFGEKIAVHGVEFAVGGNTGNNAVGLTRMGYKVAMAGTMGSGWTDKRALDVLKSEGVETKYILTNSEKDGFGVVINYQEERTILSYYPESLSGFPDDPELSAKWIYLTTAGAKFEQFYDQSLAWALKNKTQIAFNPGSRQLKAGLEKLKPVLSNTHLLFLNREEAAHLLSAQVSDVKALLRGLVNLGAKVAIITDGPEGTYSYDGNKYLHMPVVDAPVVERTGAGDAFGAGFMSAYLQDKSISESLQWGTVNSASVLGFVGPQAGLLTKEKMPAWLARGANVRVEEI